MTPVRHYHFLFSGFTQKWSDPTNGLGVVYRSLRGSHPESEVIYQPWHVSAEDLAGMVIMNSQELYPEQAKITVAGYSFGGTTALNLCRALYLQGQHRVSRLCLVDAVKRRSLYPHGWLAAFNRTARLWVPPNVERFVSFYQRVNWPRGHVVRMDDSSRTAGEWMRLDDPHSAMDSHDLVRNTILSQAESVYVAT
jgi:thioesterase domain-containing protein